MGNEAAITLGLGEIGSYSALWPKDEVTPDSLASRIEATLRNLQSQSVELQQSIDVLKDALGKWGGVEFSGDVTSVDRSSMNGKSYKCPEGTFAIGTNYLTDGVRQMFLCRKVNVDVLK